MSDTIFIVCMASVPIGIVACGIGSFFEQKGKAAAMNAEARLLEARRALAPAEKGERDG